MTGRGALVFDLFHTLVDPEQFRLPVYALRRSWNTLVSIRPPSWVVHKRLLMDGTARIVIHRHGPARQVRETSLQRHFLAQADTA